MNRYTDLDLHLLANIWRFYADVDGRWKWQLLSAMGSVIDQSMLGFDTYEECVADAGTKGYVLQLGVPGAGTGKKHAKDYQARPSVIKHS